VTTYTHKKSLRHTTDEQFSEGTTVDGSRLDRAMDELTGHYNNIPSGDLVTRFAETKYVFGYRANREYKGCLTGAGTYYYAHHWPWVPVVNNAFTTGSENAATGNGHTKDWQNQYLAKGVDLGMQSVTNAGRILPAVAGNSWGVDWNNSLSNTAGVRDNVSVNGPDNGYQYAWTTAFYFSEPAFIDDLMVNMFNGAGDSGTRSIRAPFNIGAAARGTYVISVVVMVDDFFSAEERENSSVEVAAHRYDLGSLKWTMGAHGAGYTDMTPAHQDGQLRGRSWRWRDLNIPLPARSRARLIITMPWPRANAADTGLTFNNDNVPPWHSFDPGGCLTVLEEVEE
jgi:hypothetical protein